MAPAATLNVAVRFATGASFSSGLMLGSTTFGKLGTGTLGGATVVPVDVTSSVSRASIRRGRQRVLDKFETGQATIEIIDQDGRWSPTNPASPFYPNVAPMRQIKLSASYNGTTYPLFAGYIDAFRYDYINGANIAKVTITASDGFKVLANTTCTAVAGAVAGETTGVRIGKVLTAGSWPTPMRTLSAGRTTVQADPGTLRSVLDAVQILEQSELGAFYFDAAGSAVFLSRSDLAAMNALAPVSFADDGTGIGYRSLQFGYDDVLINNQVNVTRVGGSVQSASDATSQATYFVQTLDRSNLLMDTDTDALNQARTLLKSRKDPKIRIESIVFDMTENVSARVLAGLTLDFLDPVSVKKAQPGGSSILQTLAVQGIEHDITPGFWTTTLRLSEPLIGSGFILGSTTSGVLGTSSLSY